MKSKKKSIITASTIIVTAVIASFILFPVFKNGFFGLSLNRYLREDLGNVDHIALISHCAEIDGVPDSVAGFKESVRLGANAVIVDLCFRNDGTPVAAADYSDADNAEPVENLFRTMNDDRYKKIKVYLNIIQLSDMSKLNSLAVEHNVIDRVYLIGMNKDHYGLITTDDTIIPFLLNYEFSSDELSEIKDGRFTSPEIIERYGAAGLVIESTQLSPELSQALNDYGIPFIVDGIKDKKAFCEALTSGADNVVVSDTDGCKKVLDKWINDMQERYKASVEKSIKELSKKSK